MLDKGKPDDVMPSVKGVQVREQGLEALRTRKETSLCCETFPHWFSRSWLEGMMALMVKKLWPCRFCDWLCVVAGAAAHGAAVGDVQQVRGESQTHLQTRARPAVDWHKR